MPIRRSQFRWFAVAAVIVSSVAAAAESSSGETLRAELKQSLTPLRLAVSAQAAVVIDALTERTLETLASRILLDAACRERVASGAREGTQPADAS